MTTRIGVVGAGFIAGRHVQSLSAVDGVQVAGVADPQADRARALAERAGATAHGSWEQLLDAGGLDALYVCVPPGAHGPVEEAALDRGLPLFVEKPLSVDVATAERIAARVEAAGVPTAVGYHWRHLDTLERARELLAARPSRLVRAAWLDRAPRVPWWAQRDQSGGQLVEQVTHLFDVARVLVGEVTGGSAVSSRADDAPGDIPEVTTAALAFDSGAVGSFSSSCTAPPRFRIGIELTAPGLGLWLTETELTVTDADGQRTFAAEIDPFLAEDTAFVAAVRGEGTAGIRCDYAEALRTHRLAVAVAEAAARGGAVALPGTVAA